VAACSAGWLVMRTATVLGSTETVPSVDVHAERVDIYVTGDVEVVDRTRATAEELFARLGLAVNVGPEGQAPAGEEAAGAPLAVVHLDLSSPLEPRLVVVEGSSGNELARRVLPPTSSLETSVEEVVHIAYLMVESFLARPTVGSASAPVPAPGPPPAPPPVTPTPASAPQPPQPADADSGLDRDRAPEQAVSFGLDAGLGLTVTALGAHRILPGAALVLGTRWANDRRSFGILGAGAVHTASDLVFADARASVRPIAGRLLLAYEQAMDSGLSVVAGAGGGLDGYRIEGLRSAGPVRTRTGASPLDPMLSGALGIRAGLSGSMFVTAAVALDVDLAPSRFVALTEDGRAQSVLEVPRARPAVWVALCTPLTGSSRSPRLGARR
jgi:hypothetical protein